MRGPKSVGLIAPGSKAVVEAMAQKLDAMCPIRWNVNVQAALAPAALQSAEIIADAFETQLCRSEVLGNESGVTRMFPEDIDRHLELRGSGAQAVMVVADAAVLQELARYYLAETRDTAKPSSVPTIADGHAMVIHLWNGVFQMV